MSTTLKSISTHLLALLLLSLTPVMFAQQDNAPPPPPPPHGPEDGHHRDEGPPGHEDEAGNGAIQRMGKARDKMRKAGLEKLMARLKTERPDDYARLVELQQTDPDAFSQEIRKFIRDNAGGDRRPKRPDFKSNRFLEELEKSNPEEFKRVKELREQNPDEFHRQMRERFKGREREFVSEEQKATMKAREIALREHIQSYRQATTDEERATIRQQIGELLGASFDDMEATQQAQIQRIEAEVTEMRKKLEQRRNLRQQIIDKRLDQLLSNRTGKKSKPM